MRYLPKLLSSIIPIRWKYWIITRYRDLRREEERGILLRSVKSKDAWQIFPAFSPRRKSLYFSSTAAVDSISKNFRQMTYSLCRVDFDPETRTLGQQVDTLYNGRANHKSAYPSLESHRMVNIWLYPTGIWRFRGLA